MAQIIRDRVKQLTTTTGTGAYMVSTVIGNNYTFAQVCNINDTFYGTVEAVDANGVPTGIWETGLYTYSAANTITRTAVHDSSNSGAAVDWPAGDKHVFISMTATLWRAITGNGSAGIAPTAPPAPTPLGKKIAYMGDSTVVGQLSTNAYTTGDSVPFPQTEPAEGTGTVYWVNPSTGNDANNGTSSSTPWKTLAKAASTATAAGSTIILMDGVYIQGQVNWASSGTSTQPITVKAQNKWGAIISSTSGCFPSFNVTGSYVTVKNLHFRMDPTNVTCGSYTATNMDIYAWASGIARVGTNPTSGNVGFKAHGIKSTSTGRAGCIKSQQDYTLIQNCDVMNMLETFNSRSSIIRNNTIRGQDVWGTSILVKGGCRSTEVYNNLIFHTSLDTSSAGILLGGTSDPTYIWDDVAGFEAYNCIAYNNIMVNTVANDYVLNGFRGAKDSAMFNNTFVNCRLDARVAGVSGAASTNVQFRNNIMIGSNTSIYQPGGSYTVAGTSPISNNVFYNFTNPPAQTGGSTSNPNLVNQTTDFHLQSGSVANNAGTTPVIAGYYGEAFTFNKDFAGITRGTTWDVGAYEYSTVADPTPVQTFAAASYLVTNGYTVVNEAVSSNTMKKMVDGTDGVHPAFTTWLAGAGATYDIFIINNCANDPNGQTTTEYETNLNTVIDAIQAAGKYVILQTPVITDYDAIISPYRSRMMAVATAQGVPLMDVYQYGYDLKGSDSIYTYCPDGAHPTQTFYNQIGTFCATRFAEIIAAAGGVNPPPPPTDPRPYNVTDSYGALIFREEFDNATLDTTKWTPNIWYETNNPTKNWDITNSSLRIWPQLDSTGKWFNRAFSTDGKWTATYGYYEARMKLCRGYGTWPAFWLFNHIGADRPEIDIMEAYAGGKVVNSASNWGTAGPECAPTNWAADVHNDASSSAGMRKMLENGGIALHKLNETWHVYACHWDSTGCQFYMDGQPIGTKVATALMNRPMFILLDLWFGSAQSGLTTGNPNDPAAPYQPPSGSTNSFEIDYVRAWALS